MQLEARGPDGNGIPVRVTEISDASVKLDANHAL
ncbi:MAG: peptidylprolyl isomerase, partial [Nitrospiraceae bacterium]